jgi:hypothetical protein
MLMLTFKLSFGAFFWFGDCFGYFFRIFWSPCSVSLTFVGRLVTSELIKAVKSFMLQASGVNVIKPFFPQSHYLSLANYYSLV